MMKKEDEVFFPDMLKKRKFKINKKKIKWRYKK